jgi:hypothetical protein
MLTEHPPSTHHAARPALAALAAILLYWVTEIVAQIGFYGPGGEIEVWGIQSALSQSATIVIGLFLGLALAGRGGLTLPAVKWVFVLATILNLAVWAWVAWRGPVESEAVWLALEKLLLLPQVVLLVWLLRGSLRPWVLSSIVAVGAFLAAHELVARQFVTGGLYSFTEEDADSDYVPVDVEALYAAQDGLMARQIARLQAGTSGEPEAFALLLGGTSYQSVFLSEVETVAGILDARYGAGPRSIRLANSAVDPLRYPMANRANMERALAEIGQRQGPEDVAFLFLTSHGQENRFKLDFPEAGTTDLTAAEFAAMLDRSRIGPAVIVVSACFSGSFIDDIAAPDRLIITAARADRTSFGCRDGAEWTEFGESFFDLALRAEPDPRKAFRIAAEDVAQKEKADALAHSEPQIHEGAGIGPVLDRLLARPATPGN